MLQKVLSSFVIQNGGAAGRDALLKATCRDGPGLVITSTHDLDTGRGASKGPPVLDGRVVNKALAPPRMV
ncbi:hypothetical protein RRG08_059214 [Elysia crispata]|uniref:Uncharacterized protein n=1 Tax=Elysia crispata TaxID=231223 RepID=A0AAE0ZEL2_9GAST|nr:hypothetical protein RRG08_059214 [Elysia crispata]